MFKNAKQLATEAMKSELGKSSDNEVTDELLETVLDLAWDHQSDPEPRKVARQSLKEQISRAAVLQSRQGDSNED